MNKSDQNILISESNLSNRAKNGLLGLGLTKISELKTININDLLRISNFGMKCYKEVQPYLEEDNFPNPKKLNAYKECTYWRNLFIKTHLKDFPKKYIKIFREMHTDEILAYKHPLDAVSFLFENKRKLSKKE